MLPPSSAGLIPAGLRSDELVRRRSGLQRSIPRRPWLIFVGVDLDPIQGVGDHGFEVRFFEFPTEFRPYLLARGHHDGRVPGAPGRLHDGYTPPRNPVSRLYNLGNREARTVAEVVDPLLALLGYLKRQNVGAPEVLDVDKVARGRAISRGIVRPENLDRVPSPRGRTEDDWDELEAGGVGVAEAATRARDVEVAQAYGGKPLSRRVADEVIRGQLRSPVGVARQRRSALGYGHLFGLPVDRGRRGKYKALHARLAHRF